MHSVWETGKCAFFSGQMKNTWATVCLDEVQKRLVPESLSGMSILGTLSFGSHFLTTLIHAHCSHTSV